MDYAKYQTIGSCNRMQTTSWDDELKLFDGISYFIDFFQDFSTKYVCGRPIEDYTINELIQYIIDPPVEKNVNRSATYPSIEDRRRSERFWREFEDLTKKREKEDKKLKKEWKKRKKPKTNDEIWENFENAIKDLMKE